MQRTVVQHLRTRGAPGLVYFHVPNGGYRTPVEGAMFKAMGVRAGVSDLLLFHDNKFIALELKAKGGRATEAQLAFLSDFSAAGGYVAVCDDLETALETLEGLGLIR